MKSLCVFIYFSFFLNFCVVSHCIALYYTLLYYLSGQQNFVIDVSKLQI